MEFLGYCKCLGNNLNVIYPFIFIYIIRNIQKNVQKILKKNLKKKNLFFRYAHVCLKKIQKNFFQKIFKIFFSKNFQKFFKHFFSNKNIHKIKIKNPRWTQACLLTLTGPIFDY